jgi:pimeloyl-ACP methyl ester carboxylesterase
MVARSRRNVLRTAGLAAGAAGAGAVGFGAGTQASADEDRLPRGVTTFVFVSGSNGSAGGNSELGLLGHRSVGVPLPGHGPTSPQFSRAYQAPQDLAALATQPSPMAGVTLDDFVAATIDVVRRAAPAGPVILVGGSMGGATISRVANAVPHLLTRLVYDAAFCCVDLPSCGDYLFTPEGSTSLLLTMPGAIGDPERIGGSRVNWRSADPEFLTKAKAALMAGGSEAEFLAMLASLQPDESVQVPVADARGEANTWGRVPRTYIRHTEDRAIPLALQDRMIAEADRLTPDNPFDVRSVATSHAATADAWPEIIEILHGLAG